MRRRRVSYVEDAAPVLPPKPPRPQEYVQKDMDAFDLLPQPIRDLLRDGKVSFPAHAVYTDWRNKVRIWGSEHDATRIVLKTMKDRGA